LEISGVKQPNSLMMPDGVSQAHLKVEVTVFYSEFQIRSTAREVKANCHYSRG
jgi:hypothetical protein